MTGLVPVIHVARLQASPWLSGTPGHDGKRPRLPHARRRHILDRPHALPPVRLVADRDEVAPCVAADGRLQQLPRRRVALRFDETVGIGRDSMRNGAVSPRPGRRRAPRARRSRSTERSDRRGQADRPQSPPRLTKRRPSADRSSPAAARFAGPTGGQFHREIRKRRRVFRRFRSRRGWRRNLYAPRGRGGFRRCAGSTVL